MLVAYLPEGMSRDAKIEQAKKGNLTTTRSVDAGQRAAADATVFATDDGQKVLSMLPDADSDRLVSEANSAFVKAAYAMLAKEDGDLVDGRPTDKFNDRLENAMMSLLFSGLKEEERTRLVGDLVNDARNLGLADFKSALAVKAAKLNLIALRNKDFDLRPELSKATRDIVKWKRSGMKFAGDYANQLNFDPKDNMPEADKPLFLALGNASQVSAKAVRQVLDAYIDGARAELQGQTLIGDKVTKATLVQRMADASAEIISSRKYSLGGTEERIDKEAFQRYINSLNENKKPYSPQSNLDIDYEERNDAHSQGEKANQANAKKDAVDCLRRCGGSLLGLSVTKDYKSVSATSLVGKTIASAEDLADAAQIYRNPHFETFRYVFVKDGKVVYANAATSRMPGASVAFVGNDANQFLDRLKAEYDKSGADGYYLLHNHPSGTMAISGPDVNVTAAIIKNFKNRNFLGHVVIDHKQYSVIDGMGQIREALPLSPSTDENQYDPSKNPSMPNAMLGMTLVNPRQVASAAKKIQDADSLPNGSLVLFGTTPQLKITCIASLPIIGMKSISEARLYALARQLSRASSSANFFLANVPPKDEKYVLPALRSGLLLDASLSDGTSIREKHMIPIKSYEYLGLDLKGKSAVTEKDAVRHSLSEAELNAVAKKDGINLDKETQEFRDIYARYRGTKQWMKAPNGKDSKLTARQWTQVRTPSFKKWAGDWEMVSNATPDIDVRSYDEGREVLLKLSGKDMESGDGLHAILSHASIDKIFSGKAVSKSVSHHAHIVAAANLEKLYSHSRELHTPEEGNRQGIKYMHRLYAPFLFDGQPLLVKISVKEFTSGESNKLYTIEAMDIEKPAGILVPERSESGTDTPAQATEDKVHQLLDVFKESIEKSTKIIDENGEPMVVYHGTKSRFYEFTDVKMGKGGAKNNRDGNLYGNGYYFTDDYYSAQTYGRRVLECFLNIRNPSRTSTMGPENDGLMVNSGFHKTYLATSPTQIKSATDNVGTFSNENPDIRYSLTEAQRKGAEDLDIDLDKETQEFRDVFARYHGTRQWMKAPNGSRTNLSARQWVQVRTPAFKQWFGDWENETQNNSKVVDENGEPKIVYHGTVNGAFTVFDKDRIGERWNADEIGFFFTSDEAIGIDYTIPYGSKEGKPHLFNVYLNIKKPLMINSKWFRENYNRSISRYDAIEIWDDNQADILDAFNQGEYDGIVINPTGMGMPQPKMYIAMESNQIKSATDNVGTFSEENPDIRYSLVTDEKINDEFKDDGKTIVTYRSAILGDDGKLYPPMATKGGEGMEMGKVYKSDEHPELRKKNGKFPLKSAMRDSGTKGEVAAAYNPYFHSQPGVLNDQFEVAYDKSKMVTVKCRVLKSDIESGYWAEGAKDPVGYAKWATAGPVTRQMQKRGGRTVILSRYIMPVDIIPQAEVAQRIKDFIGDEDVTIPWNVVNPSLRDELEKIGVKIGSEAEYREAERIKNEKKKRRKAGMKVGSEEDFRQAEQKRTRRYSLIGKKEDDAYMAAAGKGDMAAAQKMVDKAAAAAGYTIKAYHGTPNGTFTVFRGWQYFTENKSYADIYQNQGASSNGYKPTAEKPRTYDVYLKTDKPFDTRNETERKIFEDEFLGKWGNGTPLSERALPDWTDGDDLVEFFEENGYDYDAIYLDEGATGGYGYEVKDRGIAIVIKNPEQIKSADPITRDDNGTIIPLSRRFAENEPDIRYSLIGPQGASRLGRTSAVAEQMEKKGKTADQIWAATGWERGADGKWRTETKPLKVLASIEKNPSQSFSDFLSSKKADAMPLSKLVSANELFKAYPELKDVQVTKGYESKTRGVSDLEDKLIYINENLSISDLENVLTHEVQHLIQEIEGFAKGGASGAMAWLGTEREFAVKEYNKLLKNTMVPDSLEDYAKNAWGSDVVTEEIKEAYKQYIKDVQNPSPMLLNAIQRAAGDNAYYKLAGEVEARNAATRSPLYGRRFVRPAETESVKREEQYVRYSLISKEEDAAYMAAVERGDMETAQKMVDDAAERNGYSADDSWRMQHRAPNRESGDPNLENIKDSDLVPDDYWDHPEWYQSSDMEREAFWTVRKHIARAEEKKAKGDNSPTFMKVYRAVSKTSNKREERVRNGDWVTPLKAYAIQEGRMNPEGYRIIQTSARLQDLYWDGNSIAEMGYDDGQNYAYKDTANNRKLLDAVTYDDDGNVIPLSKRFNKRDIRTRYSLRRNQSNPIVSDGKVRADYQELLDNGRYTPEHVAEWETGAVQWIRKVGGVENAVGLIVDGLEPSGKIGTMACRLVMESDTFKALPKETQETVEMRHVMQGTEWGREGVARRVASMTLDSAAKVRRVIDAIRSKLTPEQRDKMREDVLRDTGIDLDKLPDDIHQDREKLDHLITATLASKATTKDKLYEYWVNAILSAPMTHVANTVGNLANFAYELGVKRLAEAAVNHFAKRPDAARFSDFRAMWASVDWKNAWRSAVQAFNIEVLDASGKYVEGAAPAIEGKKGRIIRIPGRFLRAADEFAKAIIVPIETAAMADRLGRQQNLVGAELDAFIKRQLRDADSEAAAYGRRRSLELTFQEDPGKIVTTLVALKNGDSRWATIVKYLFPFMKTPYNLLRQGIRKSPLGTLSLLDEGVDILRGKRQADSDFIAHAAEQVVAWSLVGMALAMGGGDNDDEPPRLIGSSKGGAAGERMFRGQHVPAYSIRIGDKYYSYKRIEPLSTMLALIADGLESYRMAKTEEGASKALRQMFTGTAHLIGEKSYLNTFSQIVQLFDEPERSIGSWTTDFAASWMPNAVRQASNAFDDVRRDPSVRTSGARWWKDQFHLTLSKAGVMRMAPKVDCFGRPITKDDAEKAGPGDILWRLLVPANTKSADAMDPAEKVIWNWNIRNLDEQYWPGVPSYRFSLDGVKYEMHGKDYADFSMESGRAAHRRILELINTGRIKPGNPREEDIAMIKQALNVSRKLTRQKYVRLHRCDKVK